MNGWAPVWGVIIVASLGSFAVLSVVVAIGGAFDILAMLRNLQAQHDAREPAAGGLFRDGSPESGVRREITEDFGLPPGSGLPTPDAGARNPPPEEPAEQPEPPGSDSSEA